MMMLMLLLTVMTVMREILSLAKALGNLMLIIMIMKALEQELMVISIGAVMYLMKVLDHPVTVVRLRTVQIVMT